VAEFVLGVSEVLLRVHDVAIKVGVVIVEGVLGDVVPFCSRLRSTHDELVVVHGFGNADGVLSSNHIGIRSVVGNEVIEIIAERSSLMLELSASGGRADRIRASSEIDFGSDGSLMRRNVCWFVFNNPLVTKSVLSVSKVGLRMDNMLIKIGVVVVESVLSNIVVLGSSSRGSKIKLVSVHSLSDREGVGRSYHIWIRSVISNGIIDIVTERSLLMLELGATR